MKHNETTSHERRLERRAMRDLVAVSTLPAIWMGLEPESIGASLAKVLLQTLSLDLIFVQFTGHPGQAPTAIMLDRHGVMQTGQALDDASAALVESARAHPTATIPDPLGTGEIRVTATRFGVSEDRGVLMAGSRRSDFPTESERLLLGLGANQTAVVLQRSRAEAEVRRSEQELTDFFENATIAMHLVGPDGTVLRANKAELDMLGYTREEYIGRPISDFHADDDVICEILKRLHAGEKLDQYPARLRCKDGSIKDVLIDSSVRWQDGRFVHTRCFTRDVTERNRAEQRFRELADAMPQIVWTAGPDGNVDYFNRRWTAFTGAAGAASSDAWSGLLHPDDAPAVRERWAASVATGAPFEMELRLFDRRRNAYSWHLIRAVAVCDEDHRVERWFGTGTDIDDQKRAQQASAYLAEASAALAGVVDYESTLQKVAALAVPYFADWAAVDVIEHGTLRRLAAAHTDPVKVAIAHQLMRDYPDDLASGLGIPAVLRSGRAQFAHDITDEQLQHGAKDPTHFRLLQSLGLKSYISAPLTASGKVFGALTFATAESGRRYTEADLAMAADLARRSSVAIENHRLYQALRDADRRKDEFLATLAHELRNPLAPISNGLQILGMPNVGAEAVERARVVMSRQVDHMVRLVDDLLDVSRVMRGKIELRREPIELATIVARAVEIVQPLIDAQAHRLDISIAPESLVVYADAVRLAQVLSNLVGNAAKYTPAGGKIRLTASREANTAVLCVEDNGIGIAESLLPRVFELFMQGDQDEIRSQGGLGIGLTLVKNLVEMHGGTVEAQSAGQGHGAAFIVRMPLSLSPARPEDSGRARPANAAAPKPSGRRVLVVDDNQDAANSLATLLRLQGHDVRVAFNGADALTLTTHYVPDVALLDIGMPDLDGFEVGRRLRQQPGCEQVVLVALTGWGQKEDRRRTAAAGFDHHLVKPPDARLLEGLLR